MGLQVRFLAGRKICPQLLADALRQFALQREQIGNLAIECFSPKLGIAPRVNQLSIHPDAIAGPACRALKNMGYSQCQPDFTQIARPALELLYRGAANDLKVGHLCQVRENVIVHSGREVIVLFVVTQIFERKNGDAFFWNIADCGGADRQRGQTSVAFLGAPDSLRSQIEYPRQRECDWKTQHQQQHNQAHRPIWNFEERKNLRCNLNEQPGGDGVGNGNAMDLAALQFGKKRFHAISSSIPSLQTIASPASEGLRTNGIDEIRARWPGLMEAIRSIHRPSSLLLHPSQRGDWSRFIGNCSPRFLPWKLSLTVSSGPLCFSAFCSAGKSGGVKSSATFAGDGAHFFVWAAASWSV